MTEVVAAEAAQVPPPAVAAWTAQMIRPLCDKGVETRASFLRTTFAFRAGQAPATLRISALGLYRAFINGKRVGDDLLTPGWTSYQARLSYQHFINEVSSLAVSFSYADSNGVGVAPATDRERAYFRIAYNRELTADWLLSGGYEMQQSATGGAAAARSNAIFLTLDRSFRFFP